MSKLSLVLLAAGGSTRFKLDVKKQWLRVDEDPLWYFVAKKFKSSGLFNKIVITSSSADIAYMKNFGDFIYVEGGSSRQESLKNALDHISSEHVLVSDIARSCVDVEFLRSIISQKNRADVIVPALGLQDTVVYDNKTIDRSLVKVVQTPQLSKTEVLKKALLTDVEYTDESSAIVAKGGSRHFVEGIEDAHKITTISDLKKISCLRSPSSNILTGFGYDVHAFDSKGEMFLGGMAIKSSYGFKAHSDGDVALHALIDALLGAAGMGDIGELFPPSDDRYKDIDSKELLKIVVAKLHNYGFSVSGVDLSIACEKPKLSKYKAGMREVIGSILRLPPQRANIKATTSEKLGFVGRGEGVAVYAVANLKYFDWTKI
ncbi:MAG: bifunctional 2-C-methyl-D-erythritol 4-phosphate cytidylyltransferase/2-C-methyl-D-erythritol 2,4-cyclodiphosphate synthase [Sulfuricurvum sp.]